MAGQIIKRGERRFLVRVYAGTDSQSGKRRYLNKTVNGGKKDAEKALNAMLRERDLGHLDAPSRVTMGQLFDDILRDYRINGKRLDWCALNVEKHLRPAFGATKVAKLTTDAIERYIESKRADGLANGTINRHLAILRRSLNLGKRSTPPKVINAPIVPSLKEAAPRTGFFEDAQYRAMLRELPEHLRGVLTFAYHTGCRKGEILGLRWEQVDLESRTVRLYAGETKNDDGRLIPLAGPLYETLAILRAQRDELWPKSSWVFSKFGEKLSQNIYGPWREACKRAGLWNEEDDRSGRLLHDARRTGARNLVRAGVPERVAMAIGGWKTRAVFDRYNIVDEKDIREAGRLLEQHLERQRDRVEKPPKRRRTERRRTVVN